jgi:hypothetical protein
MMKLTGTRIVQHDDVAGLRRAIARRLRGHVRGQTKSAGGGRRRFDAIEKLTAGHVRHRSSLQRRIYTAS